MKTYKKTITTLLPAAVLLIALLMAGCSYIPMAKKDTSSESNVQPQLDLETEPLAESDGFGIYVKLERSDASSVALNGGSFTKVCENADGSLLKAGEWLFFGDDIVQLSKEENSSVLFAVSAYDTDDTLLGEGTFLYDVAQEKLYVTISADGVACSTSDAPDAPADVPPVLTLPILDEINENVTVGTSGSSLLAVQSAVKLLDWGVNTGLDPEEISEAASTWLAAKNEDLVEVLHKLELVDDVYQRLLTEDAWELLDSAGCEETEITWGNEPIEPIEAIMRSAGLRSADNSQMDSTAAQEAWKTAFEKSLFDNYGVKPHHYEELENGVYQVYVEIDGKIVPYVAVDSKTGDYHG